MKIIRRHILVITLLVSLVAAPFTAFAVNDVVIQDSMNIALESPSTTLVIEPVTVDQIVVNTANVVITMSANGSAVTITSADRYIFTVSGIDNSVTNCGASVSTLTLPAQTTAVAVTITPSTLCSDSSVPGALPLNLAPAPTSVTPSSTTGNVTATGSLGGETTVTTSDGNTAKVDVPSSAISVDTTFTVTPAAKTASSVATQIAAVPSGQQVVGANIYNYTATVGSTAVTSFASVVTLTFTYTDTQVAGLALSSLRVHKYDEATGAWTALATTVNAAKKTITVTTTSFSYFAIFGSAEEGETPVIAAPGGVGDTAGSAIIDGDLITTATSFDIYIVKLIGDKKFKRLILNPAIFNFYGHLDWGNVKTVSQSVQDAYTTSTLVLEVNPDGSIFDPKVYNVTSSLDADVVGEKHWINLTAEEFVVAGYDWDAVYHINHTEASPDFYSLGSEITG